MMKKASLITTYHYHENKIFNINDSSVNRDDCLYPNYLLKKELEKLNVDLSTDDINAQSESELSIHFDYNVDPKAKVNYLVIMECEVIKPENWKKSVHEKFDKVFTWQTSLVDDVKYFKLNFTNKFPTQEHLNNWKKFEDRKLCSLIAGNKMVNHPLELYSERRKAIRWFEKNNKDSFSLYGTNWDKYCFSNRFLRKIYNVLSLGDIIKNNSYISYKGKVDSKISTLDNYKFAICYENAIDIPDYVTEKLFDCFFAGCIPVYLGPKNISDHIPVDCFIDKRNFPTYEELYKYMSEMTPCEANVYRESIKNYILSEGSKEYESNIFSKTMMHHIKLDSIV